MPDGYIIPVTDENYKEMADLVEKYRQLGWTIVAVVDSKVVGVMGPDKKI